MNPETIARRLMITPTSPLAEERAPAATFDQLYEYTETRELVSLVNDATNLIHFKGEAAFGEFGAAGSRWRHEEAYIFVLDPEGNMLVHPDPVVEGRNQLGL